MTRTETVCSMVTPHLAPEVVVVSLDANACIVGLERLVNGGDERQDSKASFLGHNSSDESGKVADDSCSRILDDNCTVAFEDGKVSSS